MKELACVFAFNEDSVFFKAMGKQVKMSWWYFFNNPLKYYLITLLKEFLFFVRYKDIDYVNGEVKLTATRKYIYFDVSVENMFILISRKEFARIMRWSVKQYFITLFK